MVNEKEIQELKEKSKQYAASQGFIVNTNEMQLKLVLNGLLKNKEKHGEIYCPCRIVTGNKEKDKKIICPCVYHKAEIEQEGHCKCRLFFKKE